ncbi:MAG TPA: DsbA family protein, partial [Bacteroidales bacterium]|nr:DsbA family protein [Bacteroidales bacterium]
MKPKDLLSLSFTGVLVLCALVITGLVIRREFFSPEPQPQVRQVEDWQQLELAGQRTGAADAPVQMVEFFDYECPFCKSVVPSIQAIQQKYGDKLSISYEHHPLEGHNHAFGAAVAAECAGRQDRFEVFHNLLFAHQDRLGELSYDSLAAEAEVADISSFKVCLENEQTASVVRS